MTDTWPRRRVLGTALAGAGIGLAGAIGFGRTGWAAPEATPVTLVRDGQPLGVVIVPDEPSEQLRHASADLVRLVTVATGAALPVVPASRADEHAAVPRLFLGQLGPGVARRARPTVSELHDDGFVIEVTDAAGRSASSVSIVGPTDWGTRFGVYEFLERFVGVRWLFPGPLGEHVPQLDELSIDQSLQSEPAFGMRVFSLYHLATLEADNSARGSIDAVWGARLREHYRTAFHHNLYRLLPVEVFGQSHPEFYPLVNGQHRVPAPGDRTSWNPRFSAIGIVEAATEQILAQLASSGDLSYSLGINDSSRFSEDEVDPEVINSVGRPDASVPYYTFVNAVAESVTAELPECTFGLLAYNNVADPPPFALHPSVTPFLTKDRGIWLHPDGAAADRRVTTGWTARASQVAWYDYRYGNRYTTMPRLDATAMTDAYTWASGNGVSGVYAELYGHLAEGAKAWVYAKQVWDPGVDVEALTTDWCHAAVGEDAAADLVAYHQVWSTIWDERVNDSGWLTRGIRANYLAFLDPFFLECATEADIDLARTLIDRVVAAAPAGPHAKRAALIADAFAFTEGCLRTFPRQSTVPATSTEAVEVFLAEAEAADDKLRSKAAMADWIERHLNDPLLGGLKSLADVGAIWSGWNLHRIWEVRAHLDSHPDSVPAVRQAAATVLAGAEATPRRHGPAAEQLATWMLSLIDDAFDRPGANLSFDEPATTPWQIDTQFPPTEPIVVDTSVTLTGSGASLRIPLGFGGGGVSQLMPAPGGGAFRAVMHFYTPSDADVADSVVMPVWIPFDASGRALPQIRGVQHALRTTRGQWHAMIMAEILPATTATVRCYFSFLGTDGASGPIHLDDFSYELMEPVPPVPEEPSLALNPSFEEVGTGPTRAAHWYLWRDSTGRYARTTADAFTGAYSLEFNGLSRGGVAQSFPFSGGGLRVSAQLRTPPGDWHASYQFVYNASTADGAPIGSIRGPVVVLPGELAPGWNPIGLSMEVPEFYGDQPVGRIQVGITLTGLDTVPASLFLDDFRATPAD